jgi:recombination endonuclease VII
MEQTKICKKCGDEKSINSFQFATGRKNKHRRRTVCADCFRASRRKDNVDPKAYEATRKVARATAKRSYRENPSFRKRILDDGFKRTYGITVEEKEEQFESQGRKCACCGGTDPKDKRGWHWDHNHKTGKGRGVVCNPCNLTIGHADESIARLLACIEYLKKHEE